MTHLIFIGRFHPVLVHLPIGILLLAFLFEGLSNVARLKYLKPAVGPALIVGAVSAVISAITGYILSTEGGYDDSLLQWHQYLGIATAVVSVAAYFILERVDRNRIRLIVLSVLTILLSVTGHLGGSLTHGEDFLFASVSIDDKGTEMTLSEETLSNPSEAKVFDAVITPILSQKCYNCHSISKQKGQLRLDSHEGVLKGGKHGEILGGGQSGKSDLVNRIFLPVEDKKHMPPEEREQLTSQEAEVIKSWIEEGASFDKRLVDFKKPHVILEFIESFSNQNITNDFPSTEAPAVNAEAVNELKESGVRVSTLGANSGYLTVSFSDKKYIAEEDAPLLKAIGKNIVELDFTECEIVGDQLLVLAEMNDLRRLTLTRSSIKDEDIDKIPALNNLSVLNLTSTRVTAKGALTLLKLKSLKKMYLFQSEVGGKGFKDLKQVMPLVYLDSGNYQLPFLTTDTATYKSNQAKK